ncbi:MAG: alpha/beta hydrolase fold protein [Myxococcales bacterium]|nr:alpha/beta hydrolase fold protein [Myxococcales bacterium]
MKAILALTFLVACGGPAIDPGLRVEHPTRMTPAEDIEWADTTFDGHGVKLYAQHWRPKSGEVRAVLVIHHGLADHSSRYGGLAERLARTGYAVWAFDMRGHARSAGPRVDVDSIDDFLDDLDAFMTLVRSKEPGKPIYLFGHSLGGLIASLYTIERQPQIAGLLLSGPGIAFDAPPLQASVVRLIAAIAPNMAILDTPHKNFSTSSNVIADMDRDPLIYPDKGAARTARAAIAGTARVWAAPERITVPLLVVTGTIDKLVAPSGGRDLVKHAGTKDATLLLYEKFNHDLLHEPNGGAERVMTDLQIWLDAHVANTNPHLMSAYPARLKGDRKGGVMSLDVDLRGEQTSGGSTHGANGGARFRFGVGRPTGYFGGLDLRAGALAGSSFEADAYLLGLAVHSGGVLVGFTGGFGVGGFRGIGATELPAELVIEIPAGPVRLLARGNMSFQLTGTQYINKAAIGSEASALLGIRFGRDTSYWANAVAGTGPYVAFTYRDLGGQHLYGFALGVDLFGAD